jgi:hypothetical protein
MAVEKITTNAIVSLTSHGVRLKYVGRTIFSILKQAYCKIVLTLYQDDVHNLPDDLQLMINKGVVDLIIANEDLGPHLKYFYTMKHYKTVPIITIDDDCLYSSDFMESLLSSYKMYPRSISCRRAHLMTFTDGILNPYNQWHMCVKYSEDYRHILATGVGGVLYPPNILNIDCIDMGEIHKCLYADDIFLKAIENRNNIGIHIIPVDEDHPQAQSSTEIKSLGLCNVNVTHNRNDMYIAKFMKDLI